MLQSTAIDALGHFLESYLNSNATDYSRMLVRGGMRIWSKFRDVLDRKRELIEKDYQEMLNAATLGGMAITHTGTSLPHGLSYYVTYEEKVAHGKAVGIFLPGYLKAADSQTSRELLELIGFQEIEEFRAYIGRVLGEVMMPEELRAQAVRGLLENAEKLKNCPFSVDERALREIIEYSLD